MKKSLTYILIFVSVAISGAFAQVSLDKFLAMDGISAAKSKVVQDGLPNPELLFAGTAEESINVPVFGKVDVTFDFSNGKSNAWSYIFRSAGKHDSVAAAIVIKVSIAGFVAIAINASDILSNLSINLDTCLAGLDLINSDKMAEIYRSNSDFMKFYNDHPNRTDFNVGLFINYIYPGLEVDVPYWGVNISADSLSKSCALQALNENLGTKTLHCNTFGSAEDGNSSISGLKMYPNPAEDNLLIETSVKDFANTSGIEIYDLFGRKMLDLNNVDLSSPVKIDIASLQPGVYIVRCRVDGFYKSERLVIMK